MRLHADPRNSRNSRLINSLIVLAHFLGSLRCSMSVGTNFLNIVRGSLAIVRHSAVIVRCSAVIVRHSAAIAGHSAVNVHRFLVTVTSYGTDVSYYGANDVTFSQPNCP